MQLTPYVRYQKWVFPYPFLPLFLFCSFLISHVADFCFPRQIFCALTKHLEGNIESRLILLAEYLRVYESLLEMKNTTDFPTLSTMIDPMLIQLKQYKSKAVNDDVIVLMTILKPKSWLQSFDMHYPKHASQAKELIAERFHLDLKIWPATPASCPSLTFWNSQATFDRYDVFTSSPSLQTPESIRASEL